MQTLKTTITITKKKGSRVELANENGLKLKLPLRGELMAMSTAIAYSVTEHYKYVKNELLGKSFKLTLTLEEI